MSVIVADKNNPNYNGNLSKVNGFYRAESYNLCFFGTFVAALSSEVDIPVTFNNPGNCLGVIIGLWGGGDRSVTVRLQENVATVWTDRASVTLAPFQIHALANAAQLDLNDIYAVAFAGFSYPVDTVASKWRFAVTQGAGTVDWRLRAQDAATFFYVAWCDTAVSLGAMGSDSLIVKDPVTIDMTCQFANSAVTTPGVCGLICSTANTAPGSVATLVWQNPPAASYAMTLTGFFAMAAHSGLRIGTSASRIPAARQASIVLMTADSGFASANVATTSPGNKTNLFLWGEIPAMERTLLAQDAAIGATQIVTQDVTNWSAGDTLFVGGQYLQTGMTIERGLYSIQSVAGNTITLTTALVSIMRKTGGGVIKLNGYGIFFSMSGITAFGDPGPKAEEVAEAVTEAVTETAEKT
jgi:hypothetical protein